MAERRPNNAWLIWLSFFIAILLGVMPLPEPLQVLRPLWLSMLLCYWTLELPHRVGMGSAWCLGLMVDVLHGNLLGQSALVLTLVVFLVQGLHRRMRMFPLWQQSLVLIVVFGLTQLAQLWLNTLTGNRPPTLLFILPALVSAILWPWLSVMLKAFSRRFSIF